MRNAFVAGLLAMVLAIVVACNGDRPAATEALAPPMFAKAGTTIDYNHYYEFTFRCTSGSWLFELPAFNLTSYIGCPPHMGPYSTQYGNFTSFSYHLYSGEQATGDILCGDDDVTTTGTFKCGSNSQLKVTDLGPGIPQ